MKPAPDNSPTSPKPAPKPHLPESSAIPLSEALRACLQDIQSFACPPGPGVDILMPAMQGVLPQLHPGWLYLCLCQPKAGKTSLALQLAQDLVDRPAPLRVLYVSTELGHRDLAKKLIVAQTGIPLAALDQGVAEEDEKKIEAAIGDMRSWPLAFLDLPGATAGQISARIREQSVEVRAFGLVVIDYVDLISPDLPGQTPITAHAGVVRYLKSLALDLGVPVLAMASYLVDDVQDNADVVLSLSCVEPISTDGRLVSLRILRHRSGRSGAVDLLFQPDSMRFSTIPPFSSCNN